MRMTKNPQGAIVAVHGVGPPAPGEILTELGKLRPGAFYRRNDLAIAGAQFAHFESEGGLFPDLLEFN